MNQMHIDKVWIDDTSVYAQTTDGQFKHLTDISIYRYAHFAGSYSYLCMNIRSQSHI